MERRLPVERLTHRRNTGINGNALRAWALLFLAGGVIGRGVIQHHLLGAGQVSTQELLEIMSASSYAMTMATISLVFQALETCAVPIFALLIVEGVQHTSDFKAYCLRVAGLALLCEIPHNLTFGSKMFYLTSRNPVFGVLLSLIMLYFYRRYAGRGLKNILIGIAVAVAGVVWCQMLKIESGACLVLITSVLWIFRGKTLYRNLAGAVVTVICSIFSPFFLAAPMGFLAVFFYNEEKGTTSRRVNYLAYPIMLVIAAAVGFAL